MDPLSITAGCVGIISAIAEVSTSITRFVRDVRDSRRELGETKRQLAELEMTLNLINDDHDREDKNAAPQMPATITVQTKLVLDSCREILVELDALIAKYTSERRRTAFQWAHKGKNEVLALNKQLEAHSRTLHMSLEFSTLIWSRVAAESTVALRQESRVIIANTEQVLEDTGGIRVATSQLLEEVEKIKTLVSEQPPGPESGRQEVMRRYLDSLTEYAESELDDEPSNGELTPRLRGTVLDPVFETTNFQELPLESHITNLTVSDPSSGCKVS